ncbi:hypothetical protein [Actinomycetospora cinnamomea]|uniref:Mce-associated membrane protein n=1 Tax=Actinomycetospora cinnamomea TaxID=663609 RepID=A0A2U1FDE9_9PSEU|nr:hypothetical protein [Actinomycetospora cinnamomea]PVZ10233.1 hypothetical protein C8D89_105313 [Actinomycetospora cinnamomea]
MPSRSRTKPGATNRRPKVAGLRQHAHAGAATRGPDVDLTDHDLVEAPDTLDTVEAPADDRSTSTTGTPQPEAPAAEDPEARATAPATAPDGPSPADAPATRESDDGRTDAVDAADTTGLVATATPVAPADPTDAVESGPDTAAPAAPAAPAGSSTAETEDAATPADTTPATDAVVDGEAPATTATTAAPTRKRKRGAGMTPRPEAATAPTRERRDTSDASAPTRTAKPSRTGGRRTEPEAAPGRLDRARAVLVRFGRSRALPVTLVVVTVVCLVLGGLAFWQGREAWTEGPVANEAVVDISGTAELVGQSREAVERIFSYDFTRLDDSVDAARTMSTNPFTDRYLQVFDQTIRVPAQQQQLTQTATVVNIGVMRMQDDRAEVMALAQFSAQRTTTGQSTNAPGLLRLQMERIDGRWKLAELTPLTAPPPAPR